MKTFSLQIVEKKPALKDVVSQDGELKRFEKNAGISGINVIIASSSFFPPSTFNIVLNAAPPWEKLKDCIVVSGEYFKLAVFSFRFGSNQKYLTKLLLRLGFLTLHSQKLTINPNSSAISISAADALLPLTEKGIRS
jgi:hypothetical protein